MGKGFILLSFSSLVWMVSSFVIHLLTGRFLGPKSYGTFGIVYAIISTGYLVLGGGVKRAVTKYVSSFPDRSGDVRLAGFKVQFVISGIIALAMITLSGPLGVWLNDENITFYIRYSISVIPIAGILYVYIGFFDGSKKFNHTAIVTIVHSTLKVLFVFLFLYLGYEIFGAVTGLLFGLFLSILLSASLGRDPERKKPFKSKIIWQFSLPVLIYFISISVLSYLDLFFVKAFLANPEKAGYYAAAQTISRLISFAMFPFGIVLLPSISSAIAKNDLESVRRYIIGSLRYVLIVLVPVCVIFSLTAEQIIVYVYGIKYGHGATALSILFIGTSCWGLTHTLVAIVQGYGNPGKPAIIFSMMIPIDIILAMILVPIAGLEGAAIATTVTFLLGMVLAGIIIYKRYSVLVQPRLILKISIAMIPAILPYIFIHPDGLLLLLCYFFSFLIYFFLLKVLGEIKKQDWDYLKSAFFQKNALISVEKTT